MRLGIDARLYGIKDRGIGRYTEKLIEYLEKISSQNRISSEKGRQDEYYIFLRKEGFQKYQPRNPHFHKVLADYQPYSLKEEFLFSFKLYQYHLDLVHFLHFRVPLSYRRPFVVTIHDLIISRFPKSRRRASRLPPILYEMKLLFYHLVLKSAVRRAKKIIAVSEATKKDIVEILKIKPEKIVVIYEGVDKLKVENWPLKIEKPYLLYVGAAYPHKNLERLLEAFKKLIPLLPPALNNLKLVLVGRKDFFYQRLEKYSQKIGLGDKVIFTGEVSDEELANFYQNALFFIFPSLCEGFGLPGLEAMAYGTPVLASSVFSLPEIFGEAAYYFNPYNIDEMTQAMYTLLKDENLKKRFKEKGLVQVKKYSWQKMAAQILEIYQS